MGVGDADTKYWGPEREPAINYTLKEIGFSFRKSGNRLVDGRGSGGVVK